MRAACSALCYYRRTHIDFQPPAAKDPNITILSKKRKETANQPTPHHSPHHHQHSPPETSSEKPATPSPGTTFSLPFSPPETTCACHWIPTPLRERTQDLPSISVHRAAGPVILPRRQPGSPYSCPRPSEHPIGRKESIVWPRTACDWSSCCDFFFFLVDPCG